MVKKQLPQSQQLPLVGIVMGSDSDWPVLRAAAVTLKNFAIPYEAKYSRRIVRRMRRLTMRPAPKSVVSRY